MRKNALLATMLLLFGTVRAWSAPVPDLQGFDEYVKRAVADWQIPALAIAVFKDGGVVFSKGYGVRELGKPDPADDRTLFAIGSITKATPDDLPTVFSTRTREPHLGC
jgi:CubicO group peptidase (beta-lactamase class C family)